MKNEEKYKINGKSKPNTPISEENRIINGKLKPKLRKVKKK